MYSVAKYCQAAVSMNKEGVAIVCKIKRIKRDVYLIIDVALVWWCLRYCA